MAFWQLLVLAGVPSSAAVLTAYLGFRDLGLRRRLETSREFVTLFASAHGRPLGDRSEPIGVGEQVATINLIADFALRERVLINAAVAGLRNIEAWDSVPTHPDPKIDLSGMEEKIPDDYVKSLEAGLKEAVKSMNKSADSTGRQEIASAARAALARIEPKMKSGHAVSLSRDREGH